MVPPKTFMIIVLLALVPPSFEYGRHDSRATLTTMTSGMTTKNAREELNPSVDFTKSSIYFDGTASITSHGKSTTKPPGFNGSPGFPREDRQGIEDVPLRNTHLAFHAPRGFIWNIWDKSHHQESLRTNDTGPVESDTPFHPSFDTFSSGSEMDFGPQDFLPRTRLEKPAFFEFFSPGLPFFSHVGEFGSERNTNKEVEPDDFSGKIRAISEDGKAEIKNGYHSSELSDDNYSGSESVEEAPEKKYEELSKKEQGRPRPRENNQQENAPFTPYSRVINQPNPSYRHPSNEMLPQRQSLKSRDSHHDVDSLRKSNRDYAQKMPGNRRKPVQYERNEHTYSPIGRSSKNVGTNYLPTPYYRPLAYHPMNVNGFTRRFIAGGRSYPIKKISTYPNSPPNYERVQYSNHRHRSGLQPMAVFKPLVKVPHLHNSPAFLNSRGPSNLLFAPVHPDPNSQQLIERSAKTKSPAVSAHKQKKFCKKAKDKMASVEDLRFEPQRMECFTCTDKGNSTYEECRLKPFDVSSSEESVERRSSSKSAPSSKMHARYRRNVVEFFDQIWSSMRRRGKNQHSNDSSSFDSNEREFNSTSSEEDQTEEVFDGDDSEENYSSDKNNFDSFSGEDSEEMSEIVGENRSPGTTEDEECRTFVKKGLFCTECQSSKTGKSSQQCSSAEDLDDNDRSTNKSTYAARRQTDRYVQKR